MQETDYSGKSPSPLFLSSSHATFSVLMLNGPETRFMQTQAPLANKSSLTYVRNITITETMFLILHASHALYWKLEKVGLQQGYSSHL